MVEISIERDPDHCTHGNGAKEYDSPNRVALLIGIGTPVGVMVIVGDRGVMRCCAVWLIGPLISGYSYWWPQAATYTLHFDSIKDLYRHSLSADHAIGQGRVRYGPVLFGGLSEETCVRSTAETRASIAQNLEGGSEGARDRVVTELQRSSA